MKRVLVVVRQNPVLPLGCMLAAVMNTSSLLTMALALVMTQGVSAVERAMAPPESWVRGVCAKTGADPIKAIEERNESAKTFAAFIEDLAGVHAEVASSLGVDVGASTSKIPTMEVNILGMAIMLYRVFGRSTLQRMLTVPQSAVQAICAKTGADVQEVMAARNAATDDLVDFIESLVDAHFVDPD